MLSIQHISEFTVPSNNTFSTSSATDPSISSTIPPIDTEQQLQVQQEVQRYLTVGESLYQCAVPAIPVLFDLKNR